MTFDIEKFKEVRTAKPSRYQRQLERIRSKNGFTQSIEQAVGAATSNVFKSKCRSFVIYGEPQSGKTEMMIALTASLLDGGAKVVIILMNDSVQLLNQNLERFRRSQIDPAPKNYQEILDPAVTIGDKEWIIFCKKNTKDLQKLLHKIGGVEGKIIIDDEADYATPNAKINKGEKTKINELVGNLLGKSGTYIGVTATPARLDLNNTFDNENERWVDFPPHPFYKGQDTFFPTSIPESDADRFALTTLPDAGDDPKYLREATFRFLVNVSHLNLKVNIGTGEQSYSLLIHTSGKKADHSVDQRQTVETFNALSTPESADYEKYIKRVWEIAKEKYPGEEDEITSYVIENANRASIVVMNSETDKNTVDYTSATNPATLFTIVIGGNIVSRGVTFENLLSMFFTRDVKHKIQQDTYIQRARMFGARGPYLSYFELCIPEKLYLDWHKCFVFHRLSVESIRTGNGSPVWLEDTRVSAVSGSSVDKTTVSMDSGEMSFEVFGYVPSQIDPIMDSDDSSFEKLAKLSSVLGNAHLPKYLKDYIQHFSPGGDSSLAVHSTINISGRKDANLKTIERVRGFIGRTERQEGKYPDAMHHIFVLHNGSGKARVFYKYTGSIRFLKNLRGKGRL